MFAGLLSSKLVFLDAIGSDPTQPRKIPGCDWARARAYACRFLALPASPGSRASVTRQPRRCGPGLAAWRLTLPT